MRKIVFASNNKNKLLEIKEMLGDNFQILSPSDLGIFDDIDETATTLEGNAEIKARYLYDKTGLDCFADDTGLEVTAINNEPGVKSARYAGEESDSERNMSLLLSNMKNVTDRSARFRTSICFISGGVSLFFEGVVTGQIREKKSGSEGFGYDPIFQPDGYNVTFAEMPLEEKNKISHRGRAVREFAQWLKSNIKN